MQKKLDNKSQDPSAVPATNGTQAVQAYEGFEADKGAGLEEADKSSYAIPFIGILQPLSPVITEEQVEGAKAGMLFNTITLELFTAIQVIPCYFQRKYLQWAPRKEGGGYRGEHDPLLVETNKVENLDKVNGLYIVQRSEGEGANKRVISDELKDTRNHFVLALGRNAVWTPALISMSSTQVKKSKRWMSMITSIELRGRDNKPFNPPSFSHRYSLKTSKEQNDKGTWYGWDMELLGPLNMADPTDAETYAKAKTFYASIVKGEVVVTPPTPEMGDDAAGDNGKSAI